ncbi:MAG: hypothetical protein E7644_08810 [Ruminococcaceae bacterium]|nr:hypothetical protein [Oscillospiraceae bacterium]
MKNIFDMNFKNDHWDGDCFKVRVLPPELRAENDALAERSLALALNEMPRLYRTLRLVCLLLAGFLAIFGIEMLSAGTLPVGVILLASAALALLAAIALHVRGNGLRRSEEESEAELAVLNRESEEMDRRCRAAMDVPEDAVSVDVPTRVYNTHLRGDGEVYANGSCPVFAEAESLCFFDGEDVLAIPFVEITGIVEVHEPITVSGWMKDQPHTAAPYDGYDITEQGEDTYCLGSYCAVRCRREGEDYQVIIPRYDIDTILALTGLPLTDGE